ncbi:hypothetical protein [Streptomyces sp. BRA346]|uniref:hypothetical protein n=1 Tax=Streptomyces sp. BRA346 TaxID=2878199 RepID=UPI004063B43B
MIVSARQVRRYVTDPDLRARVQDRLARAVTDGTEAIVAHSLGTVVYETLCAQPSGPTCTSSPSAPSSPSSAWSSTASCTSPRAHDVRPYLTARETGAAVAEALAV